MSTKSYTFTEEERKLLMRLVGIEEQIADDDRMMTNPESKQEKDALEYQTQLQALQQKLRA